MRKGSKQTISRVLASVIIASSVFSGGIYLNANDSSSLSNEVMAAESNTSFKFVGEEVKTTAGSTVDYNIKLVDNPGISNYTIIVKYDPKDIMAISGDEGDFEFRNPSIGITVNDQLKYVPWATDPDYLSLADGVKTSAEIGILKYGIVANKVTKSDATAMTLKFKVKDDAKEKDRYPVNIEVIGVGDGTAEKIEAGNQNGFIEIIEGKPVEPSESTESTEATTDSTESTESTEATTEDTETTTRRPGGGSSGGGGKGGSIRTTTTTETTTEVTTEEEKEAKFGIKYIDADNHEVYLYGYPDGRVMPGRNITRAEVAAIFSRLMKIDQKGLSTKFSDVPSDMWYYDNIANLESYNIIAGYPDGTFRTDTPITRAEFVTIIVQYIDQSDMQTITPTNFSDANNHWASSSIRLASSLGIISGYPDGTFRPNDYITRAEAVVIVNGLLSRDKISQSSLISGMISFPDNADTNAWYYLPIQEATNSHDHEKDENGHETWTELRNK